MDKTTRIKYTLESAGASFEIDLSFNNTDFSLINIGQSEEEWTRLDYYKCSHCPLDSEKVSLCPLANTIDNCICSGLGSLLSYDEIFAQVEFRNRVISSHTTTQIALSSLLGLLIPTSGCPHTLFFRPLSRFHTPFSNPEETVYRSTSMFLLMQYFVHRKNGCIPPDFSQLEKIYQNIHLVNKSICKRLRDVHDNDISLNAIVILDTISIYISSSVKHDLSKLDSYFAPYLTTIGI